MECNKYVISTDDFVEIHPLYGKKSRRQLKFSEYMINLNQSINHARSLNLEGLCKDKRNFRLVLKKTGFRMMGDKDFLVNGTYTRDALIQDGDRVEVDQNILVFKSSRVSENEKDIIDYSEIPISILLVGETGTGKTRLAREIHNNSKRRGAFVHVSLASFSQSLIESEIFGHKKGAFTGAIHEKLGAIMQSKGGTLFLDEIDSIDKNIQTKLLLFLDTYKFRAVGSDHESKVETSLIFASSTPLESLLEKDLFRKDFYYRIDGSYKVSLSPLRLNKEKIVSICTEFEKDKLISIDRRLISFYQNYSWPGNIRQLLHHLEKKYLFNKKRLTYDQLDQSLEQKLTG